MAIANEAQTIFAQSTARGRSAIALHRISGSGCHNVLAPFLKRNFTVQIKKTKTENSFELAHGTARYCNLYDFSGKVIDDCVITFYRSPNSYTGEDTLEIASHGNPLISAQIHALLRQLDMRDARPGEFTQRAFLNGKIDLTRAEAIDQLIHADTVGGIELARDANSGMISEHTDALRLRIISLMAYFEAHIDFAEDEIGTYDSRRQTQELREIQSTIERLASSFENGLKMREGLKLVFAGEPNAGKSSLYNALLGTDRAIVTDVPGTTRDVVEDRLVLEGRDFVILDTAGLRETTDTVEKLGIKKTISSISDADVVCCIVDPQHSENGNLRNFVKRNIQNLGLGLDSERISSLVLTFTKSDQWSPKLAQEVADVIAELKNENLICVRCSSASADVDELKLQLINIYDLITNRNSGVKSPILISSRQRDKAKLASTAIHDAIHLTEKGDFPEKIASLLVLACQHLGEVIGEVGTEDVLNSIFANFCIGK
ncbi:MAG: hypothetical protein RIR26_819 [Pseudomonadota bacterium]|jgi:tRNA modification GTPase